MKPIWRNVEYQILNIKEYLNKNIFTVPQELSPPPRHRRRQWLPPTSHQHRRQFSCVFRVLHFLALLPPETALSSGHLLLLNK